MPSSLHKVQKSISKKRQSKNGKSHSLTALHEDSRDAKRIRRAAARDDKVIRQNAARNKLNDKYLTRLAFFHSAIRTPALLQLPATGAAPLADGYISGDQDNATTAAASTGGDINMSNQDATSHTLTAEEKSSQNATAQVMHHLIDLYLNKHSSKISQLDSERRKGRPKGAEQVRAEHERDADRSEYDGGFWMPELRTEADRERFAEWNGKWEGLGPHSFVHVRRRQNGEEWRVTVRNGKFPPSG